MWPDGGGVVGNGRRVFRNQTRRVLISRLRSLKIFQIFNDQNQ